MGRPIDVGYECYEQLRVRDDRYMEDPWREYRNPRLRL